MVLPVGRDPFTNLDKIVQQNRRTSKQLARADRIAKRPARREVARLIRRQNRRQSLLLIKRTEEMTTIMAKDNIIRAVLKVTVADPLRRAAPKLTGATSKSSRVLKGKKPRKKDKVILLARNLLGGLKSTKNTEGREYPHFIELGTKIRPAKPYFYKNRDRNEKRFKRRVYKLTSKKFIKRVTDAAGRLR